MNNHLLPTIIIRRSRFFYNIKKKHPLFRGKSSECFLEPAEADENIITRFGWYINFERGIYHEQER